MHRLVPLCLLLLLAGAAALAQEAPAAKPAILFCCPGENRYAYAGFDYMQSLEKAGFVVDYLEGARELTWDRVKDYNVLVVYDFPPRGPGAPAESSSFAPRPPWLADYWAVLDRFLKSGGGLFLHYWPFFGGAAPNDLLQEWGIQFPLLWLRDPAVQQMTNMPSGLAYTDRINPEAPVSAGVRGFWYPYDNHYVGQHTMPILVDGNWQVVARAGAAAYTVLPTYDPGGIQPLPGALIPAEPVRDPVLFAVRDYPGGGRLAAVHTWFNFSIGSGMKWLYNNEVLSKGLGNRPSDYGKLLQNTYTWLAQPSLQTAAVGGAQQDPLRLVQPMLRPGAMDQFHDWYYEEDEILQYHRPPMNGRLYRGLIGAQTALSGGQGSVADYARAAAAAGLDFLIFLEDMAQMTPEKLDTLKAEVERESTPTLKLFAGYRLPANTGNWVFITGKQVKWPEDRMLVGPNRRTLNLQYQNEQGEWAFGNPGLNWCLDQAHQGNTVGYYNFTKSGNGMAMYDLKVYSMAAIRTYEAGKLVEDMTDDYLTTCQCTLGPTPVSVNLVRSPAELTAAVAANQALTYGQARSLDQLWDDALRWQGPYDGMNVFPSDGPRIQAWPKCLRVMTFGAEQFVSGRSMWPSPIHVTSEVGLKEIRLYDGRELFRRFLCHGDKEFDLTLFFPGTVQRSLVLIAEDVQGGVATSFAYRQYKEGGVFLPIFCSDHVNDCAYMLLAHGPHWPSLFRTPTVPDAGDTWDGGPLASRPLLSAQFTYPALFTDQGDYTPTMPYQIPLLEFSDEGSTRCRMVANRMVADGVPEVNPWYTFGPLQPTKLADLWGSHAVFGPYITGVQPNAYGAPGVLEGPIAHLFTEQFTFKQACTVSRLRLYHSGWREKTAPRSTLLALGRGGEIYDVWDLTDTPLPNQTKRRRIETGDWFALFSSQSGNSHLFINRSRPFTLEAHHYQALWLQMWADLENTPVQPGDTYDTEIFAQVWPLDQSMTDARSLADMVTYLEQPTGLELIRGARVPGPGGLLELTPDNYAVELSLPQPEGPPRTVPVRVSGLNRRWSVGMYQVEGWRTHYYSPGNSGWRALGLDFDNRAYVPLYVSKSPRTHVLIGHPLVADAAGKDLFLQATRLNDGLEGKPPAWHLSVNNPTDQPITTTLKRAMDVPGLNFTEETVTLAPGEYRVLNK